MTKTTTHDSEKEYKGLVNIFKNVPSNMYFEKCALRQLTD